ncbi:non-hydrolyzing UDP-N-acetylglucosamine 2-epimerase [Micromonospora radicis]|uniref:UDP-N-acetylglucosamine 2-epimerase (Non-hydrolyzing) n=1 Tax=Micromonospora radicis TaxID=1894971 RepID=A0A418MY68_9ACTN|nr:UDP-N-acetylglucosamine 2-epimerase (non-hydrolyzing) [Micromonospora radicis]RIV39647.1 UDP-N-acetylglucosamine 2-epimerase (non-hydrolyzing) [Micromonospora radicis]
MTRVMTVVGTRPEIIRLSRVMDLLDRTVEHVLLHTGQNWDPNLSEIFFTELRLRQPDRFLNVDTSSLGRVLAGVLTGMEEAIRDYRPDALLVLGDTNSSIGALMARRMRVPVYHMEAGNRCFDLNVPEETNRRLVDHISDFNLVYTEHARRNLLAEGLHPRRILLTGSPMREVLEHYRADVENSTILSQLALNPGDYFVVSAHREENVDSPQRLGRLLDCLRAVRDEWALPVLVSTHPRTRKRLEALTSDATTLDGISFHEPFGLIDYVRLQSDARCTLSDSGTVSEEAAIVGFPAVTLRDAMERPEALDVGSIVMTGLDPAGVVEAVRVTIDQVARDGVPCPVDYQVADTSRRVLDFILSTVRRHHDWAGIRR